MTAEEKQAVQTLVEAIDRTIGAWGNKDTRAVDDALGPVRELLSRKPYNLPSQDWTANRPTAVGWRSR